MLTIIMVCFENHSLLLNLQYEKALLAKSRWDLSSASGYKENISLLYSAASTVVFMQLYIFLKYYAFVSI